MAPVTLRLRGPFIDFCPDHTHLAGTDGVGTKVRSFSTPPRLYADDQIRWHSSSKDYLQGLVFRTMKLSESIESTSKAESIESASKDYQPQPQQDGLHYVASDQEEFATEKPGCADWGTPLALFDCLPLETPRWPQQQEAVRVTASDQQASQANQLGCQEQEIGTTSLMIRNIPYKMTLKGLMSIIDKQGFAGTYDFLHLPGRGYHFSNLGYAFINFCTSAAVVPFVAKFHGVRFSDFSNINTQKVIEIRPAHAQGLAHNIAKVRHILSNNEGSSLFIKDS